ESACAPVPQVQVYVPGVNPRLLKVAPEKVSVADSDCPDVYPAGTSMSPLRPVRENVDPVAVVALVGTPPPSVNGPVMPWYASAPPVVKLMLPTKGNINDVPMDPPTGLPNAERSS